MPWISAERLAELEHAERFVERSRRVRRGSIIRIEQETASSPEREKSDEYWPTIHEAAELYGMSEKTIRRRLADGSLDARRFGPRLIRINPKSLERWGETVSYRDN